MRTVLQDLQSMQQKRAAPTGATCQQVTTMQAQWLALPGGARLGSDLKNQPRTSAAVNN